MKALQRLLKNIKSNKSMLLMMLPVFTFVVINSYLPMFGVIMAFKNIDYRSGILRSPWVGLRNFRYLFSNDLAFRITRNTVGFSLAFIAIGMVLAVSIAILLNEIRAKSAKKIYQTIIILPNFLSIVVVSYVVYAFLDPVNGLVNKSILEKLGIKGISWYSKPEYWIAIAPIVNFWMSAGISSIIYLAGIAGIDPELYEAAIVDGASKRRQIWSITLPMLKPIIIISLIMSLGGLIRSNFGLFYQVTLNSQLLYSVTDTIDTYVYRALTVAGYGTDNVARAAAAGLYQSVVGAALVALANFAIRKIEPESALF
ncbi:MAG: ABC transporter permease subunit [Clostridiales bacterium]|nr:ABC transporter permease subunit [Clostridiales bacterium]